MKKRLESGSVAVVPAARGQNTVGSCAHSSANYTLLCVSSVLKLWGHWTIWQLPSRRQLTQANKEPGEGRRNTCSLIMFT